MPQARTNTARTASLSLKWLLLLTIVAALVRGLWLNWQPLWWDEGYSFYFATESIPRMVALTAEDIHPPLYYLLLHEWFSIGMDPVRGRLFSVVVGALAIPLLALLGHELYPQRHRLKWIAAFLLLLNPMHLYYSQEVRMYGLALLLGIASTLFIVRSVKQLTEGESAIHPLFFYWLCATLSLYTLYYLGFLLLAQAVWTLWSLRKQWKALLQVTIAWLAILLAYLPWLLYAGLKLTAYVQHKVASDKDQPLAIGDFLLRHITTFVAGHGIEGNPLQFPGTWVVLCLLAVIALSTIRKPRVRQTIPTVSNPLLLWLLLIVPTLCAFLVNQQSPFFPVNGERLLLMILPYFLLLLTVAIDGATPRWLGGIGLAGLFALALVGVVEFYTQPRYTNDDYRPLIQQIVQQSTANDTFLATFPWQVGFWRAYVNNGSTENAKTRLLSDGTVEWGTPVASVIDQSLQTGVVWFPSLLSIGSSLPSEVNNYFTGLGAFNIADRWFSETTRLDAWRKGQNIPFNDVKIDFGGLFINGVGFAPQQLSSANQPVDIRLRWTIADPGRRLNLSFRLQDAQGRTWMQRDYTLVSHWHSEEKGFVEHIGLIIPPGLPPDNYRLVVSVSYVDSGESLTLRGVVGADALFATLATLAISPPQSAISPQKLPIQKPLATPPTIDGLSVLGYSGAQQQLLAGEPLQMGLFYQKMANTAQSTRLFVSLLAKDGSGVAGWEGWPLDNYPIDAWPIGALVQVPVRFDLPATIQSGSYRMVTGLIDEKSGKKSDLVELGNVDIKQRVANFEPLTPPHPLDAQPLFGSHATLLGYALEKNSDGVLVRLYWRVEQTLLPTHHIFVHFDDAQGTTVAQVDGAPVLTDGNAPTGSWQPGEMLVTLHQLKGTAPDYDHILVGLYNPLNNQRLPVTVSGSVTGDAVELR